MKEEVNLNDLERELSSLRPVRPSAALKQRIGDELSLSTQHVRVARPTKNTPKRTSRLSWAMAAAVILAFTCWVGWHDVGKDGVPARDVVAGNEDNSDSRGGDVVPDHPKSDVYHPPTWLSLAEALTHETTTQRTGVSTAAPDAASWLPPPPPFRNVQVPVFAFAGNEP